MDNDIPFNVLLYHFRTINELEAQLDYERLRREKLEAQLDQYRRDMAELSYRLQSREIEDSGVRVSVIVVVRVRL